MCQPSLSSVIHTETFIPKPLLWSEPESPTSTGMPAQRHHDQDDTVIVPIRLPADTIRWLAQVGRESGNNPVTIIQSMIEAIRADDEQHHIVEVEPAHRH